MTQNEQFVLVVAVPLAWVVLYTVFLNDRMSTFAAVVVGVSLGAAILAYAVLTEKAKKNRNTTGTVSTNSGGRPM